MKYILYVFFFTVIFFGILLFVLYLRFINIPFFPTDYSIITFLVGCFNILFGGSLLISIFFWYKQQQSKLYERMLVLLNDIHDLYFELAKLDEIQIRQNSPDINGYNILPLDQEINVTRYEIDLSCEPEFRRIGLKISEFISFTVLFGPKLSSRQREYLVSQIQSSFDFQYLYKLYIVAFISTKLSHSYGEEGKIIPSGEGRQIVDHLKNKYHKYIEFLAKK